MLYRYSDFSSMFINGSDVATSRGSKDSLWWRDIVNLESAVPVAGWFSSCVRGGLGDETSIDFWQDHWIGRLPLKLVFPLVYASSGIQHVKVAEIGHWSNNEWSWLQPWRNMADLVCLEEATTLQNILVEVKLSRDQQDSWIWTLEANKKFSVRSCYKFLVDSFVGDGTLDVADGIYQKLWQTDAPSKVLNFVWRLFRNSLPTRERLLYRQFIADADNALCPFCSLHSEDVQHLFLDCSIASEVRKEVGLWLGLNVNSHSTVLLNIFYYLGLLVMKRRPTSLSIWFGSQLVSVFGWQGMV